MGDCPGRESVEEGKEVKDDTFKEKDGGGDPESTKSTKKD